MNMMIINYVCDCKIYLFLFVFSEKLAGDEILQVGRDLGVEDKEGIRITQVSLSLKTLLT